MHQRRALLATAALLAMTGRLHAQPAAPSEVKAELPDARLLGTDRLRVLFMHVYDARLWAGAQAPGTDWSAVPLALELEYARSLDGKAIAERSLEEMRRQGDIGAADAKRWLGSMVQLFPDVKAGDRITGVNLPEMGARFYLNGKPRGEVREPAFAKLFFGIWLSPRTSEPAMREALLGRRAT